MRVFSLALLAASAIGAVSIGSATAMPFANPAPAHESLVQDVRVVCDRNGRCYNTNRNAKRYYAPHTQRYGYRGNNYRGNRAYGYHRGGPGVGIGVGPVGIGIQTW
jgi:hypothetical protein